jgi:hypothetical protein
MRIVKKTLAPLVLTMSSFYWGAISIYAETKSGLDWTTDVKQENTGGPTDLVTWLPQVLNLAIGLAALVCVAVLIGSGYMYITAAGDETKVEKATKSLTGAIIGLVICFISVILVEFVLKNVLAPGA